MKQTTKGFILINFLFFSFIHELLGQVEKEPIIIGDLLKFESKILDEKRPIQVYLPDSYSDSSKKYPVFYILDAGSNAQSAAIISRRKSMYNAHFPEMIVVGINNVNRNRDFETPDGAEKMLRFIETELIPYIDKSYRTENYRILFGHSSTGHFSLYALSKSPELFNSYINLTPHITWEHALYAKNSFSEFMSEQKKITNKIYLGFSDSDRYQNNAYKSSYLWIDSLIQAYPDKIKEIRFEIIEREDHWSEPLIGIYKGLDYIFYSWRVPMETMIKADIHQLRKHIDSLSVIYGYKHKYPEDILSFYGNEGYLQGHTEGLFTNNEPLFESAIEIFKLNIENYPNSSNAYYDLGNSYFLNGDKKEARLNLIKSLEINPKNKRAKDILKKIEGE